MSNNWISTYSGKKFCFEKIDPRVIDLNDICQSLAMIPRFNGHTIRHLSVAEHSLNVSTLLPVELKLDGLLHDAAEAYIGDICRPFKALLNSRSHGYIEGLEASIMAAIYKSIKRREPIEENREKVKHADQVAIVAEAQVIQPKGHMGDWGFVDLDGLKKEAQKLSIRREGVSHMAMATRLKESIQALL